MSKILSFAEVNDSFPPFRTKEAKLEIGLGETDNFGIVVLEAAASIAIISGNSEPPPKVPKDKDVGDINMASELTLRIPQLELDCSF